MVWRHRSHVRDSLGMADFADPGIPGFAAQRREIFPLRTFPTLIVRFRARRMALWRRFSRGQRSKAGRQDRLVRLPECGLASWPRRDSARRGTARPWYRSRAAPRRSTGRPRSADRSSAPPSSGCSRREVHRDPPHRKGQSRVSRMAARTRSRPSCTAASGRPTIRKLGSPLWAMSTSTSTSAPSIPTTAPVSTLPACLPSPPAHGQGYGNRRRTPTGTSEMHACRLGEAGRMWPWRSSIIFAGNQHRPARCTPLPR